MEQEQRLGILGGMGPQATQVFYQRILDKTDASRDQEHVPTLIWSDTGMPDRTRAILSGETEPVFARLLSGARLLEREGCTLQHLPFFSRSAPGRAAGPPFEHGAPLGGGHGGPGVPASGHPGH